MGVNHSLLIITDDHQRQTASLKALYLQTLIFQQAITRIIRFRLTRIIRRSSEIVYIILANFNLSTINRLTLTNYLQIVSKSFCSFNSDAAYYMLSNFNIQQLIN